MPVTRSVDDPSLGHLNSRARSSSAPGRSPRHHVARIVHGGRRPRSPRRSSAWSTGLGWFVPAVIAAAVATSSSGDGRTGARMIRPRGRGLGADHRLPCALGLATPIRSWSASAGRADRRADQERRGARATWRKSTRGGRQDRTLTEGKPSRPRRPPWFGEKRSCAWPGVERASEHPLPGDRRRRGERGIGITDVTGFDSPTARACLARGRRASVARKRGLPEEHGRYTAGRRGDSLRGVGRTAIYIGVSRAAGPRIADPTRPPPRRPCRHCAMTASASSC